MLEHLERESGLLLGEGGGLYGLPHLSYEEYLAGCHLGQQVAFRELAYEHWQRDPGRWREVIFLALGRMVRDEGRETAAGWLAFLLATAHGERVRLADERQRAAYFAHECLEQMGGKVALIGVTTVALPELWAGLATSLAGVVVADDQTQTLWVEVTSTHAAPACPRCAAATPRVQSHDTRTLADLPWADVGVQVLLHVRKCFCSRPHRRRSAWRWPPQRVRVRTAPWSDDGRAMRTSVGSTRRGGASARSPTRSGCTATRCGPTSRRRPSPNASMAS